MYIVSQLRPFSDNQAIRQCVYDWLILCQLLAEPDTYYINDEKNTMAFDNQALKQTINDLNLSDNLDWQFAINSKQGEFSLHLFKGHIRERLLIDWELFNQHGLLIEDYLDRRMEQNGFYAYIRSLEEYLSHNVESFTDREEEGLVYPLHLPKMYDEKQEIVTDCSQLGGYDFYYKGLCFTSCWKMWVTSSYYHVIPKQAYLDIQQVEAVQSLAKDVLRITLYQQPLAWQHPQNLAFQLLFRDQLGFDQLEWSNGVGVLRAPLTEFIKVGDNTQMIQFQNASLQPTIKNLARHFTTRVFNYETAVYAESRRFGKLNNRAYFPWQDAAKRTMLAYWILDPKQMIDNGLEAFTFYIKQYLLVAPEEETKGYQAILRFYVPQDTIKIIPLEKLVTLLTNQSILVSQKSLKKSWLQIETAFTTLQVEFVDIQELKMKETDKKIETEKKTGIKKLKKFFLKNN